jgi:hypothetical protein
MELIHCGEWRAANDYHDTDVSTKVREEITMDTTTLIILIVLLFLLFGGGGGYWWSRRR